jgi:molybdopterin-guanine dinucleotide biosynthesis protein A
MRILILAGGQGRRIGGGKPGRRLGGVTLLDRALGLARSWSDDVSVASGESDAPGIAGPLGGVAAALVRGGDLLTIPCDMPFLPEDLPERLHSKETATIATSGGRLHPVCALWRARAIAGLADYVASGRRSLRGFAEAVGYETVAWDAEPVDPFFNVNDEADLARAEALLKTLPRSS